MILPFEFRCFKCVTALLVMGSVLSCQRQQPPPLYKFDTGVADIVVTKPPKLYDVSLATATENRILHSPSDQPGDHFGASIAITLTTLVVGAPNTTGGGAAWVFDLADANAAPIKLIAPYLSSRGACGASVAISDSGRFIAVGAPNSTVQNIPNVGVVHVWEKKDGQWTYEAAYAREDLLENSMLGKTVAINDETLLAGAPFATRLIPIKIPSKMDPDVYTIEYKNIPAHGVIATWMRVNNEWIEDALLSPDNFIDNAEFGAAMSLKGVQLIVGAPCARASEQIQAGKSYIFIRRISGWPQSPVTDIAQTGSRIFKDDSNTISGNGPYNHFGWAVNILGTIALAGTPGDSHGNLQNCGSINIYQRITERTWIPSQYIHAADGSDYDAFGSAVGIAQTQFVIGAPMKSENDLEKVGAVYIYQFIQNSDPFVDEFVVKLLPLQPVAQARFGSVLACTSDIIAISAPGTTYYSNQGKIYIFNRSEISWGVPGPTITTTTIQPPSANSTTESDVAPSQGEIAAP